MIRNLLATTAIATLVATGAFAQEATTPAPAPAEPAAPMTFARPLSGAAEVVKMTIAPPGLLFGGQKFLHHLRNPLRALDRATRRDSIPSASSPP